MMWAQSSRPSSVVDKKIEIKMGLSLSYQFTFSGLILVLQVSLLISLVHYHKNIIKKYWHIVNKAFTLFYLFIIIIIIIIIIFCSYLPLLLFYYYYYFIFLLT